MEKRVAETTSVEYAPTAEAFPGDPDRLSSPRDAGGRRKTGG